MCTMTWRATASGYGLFFNRDERHERQPAAAPSLRNHGGTSFLAPTDGDFGGSWIAVNEHGLSLCLLNGPAAPDDAGPHPADYSSRGEIPLALIGATRPSEAASALRELRLGSFRPFVVVALAPDGGGMVGRWSGRDLELRSELPRDQPLISSSFCTEKVRQNRVAVFGRMRRERPPGTRMHLDYHRRHEPEAGPYSPCMHRPDAGTVSFSWIEVDEREVRFRYVPSSPCLGEPGPATTLPRAAGV